MGFFDKLFGGKAASETKFSGQKMTVMLPIDGKVIPLERSWAPAAAWSPPATPFMLLLTAPLRRCPKACTPLV